jgi:hypothetical protein
MGRSVLSSQRFRPKTTQINVRLIFETPVQSWHKIDLEFGKRKNPFAFLVRLEHDSIVVLSEISKSERG